MARALILTGLITVLAAGLARADHSTHNCDVWRWHCAVDRARADLAAVEDALYRANADADAARREYDTILADQARLAGARDRGIDHAKALRAELDAAEGELKALDEAARKAEATADAARRELETLRPQFAAADQARDAAIDEAVRAFEATDASKSAIAAMQSAEAGLIDAEMAAVQSLAETRDFRALRAEVDDLEATLKELRKQHSQVPDVLTETSHAWIDAQNRLNRKVDAAKESDPRVVAAVEKLDAARAQLAAVRGQFESDLPDDPKVAATQKAFDEIREPYEAAVNASNVADNDFEVEKKALASRNAAADQAQAELASVESDIDRFSRDLDAANAALPGAHDRLERAAADLHAVRADRLSAIAALRDAEASQRIAVCSVVVIVPRYGREDPHHYRDHRHGGYDYRGGYGRDRDSDRRGDFSTARRPRIDGEPVGRARRPGDASFLSPTPVAESEPAAPSVAAPVGQRLAGPASVAPRLVRPEANVQRRQAAGVERIREAEQQRVQAAAAKVERDASERAQKESASLQRQNEARARAARQAEEAARESARQAEREQQKAARAAADQQRETQRAAERQQQAAARDAQRQQAERERESRRAAERQQQPTREEPSGPSERRARR